MFLVSDAIGEVLLQLSTGLDGHNLHPPADPQQGQVAVDGCTNQRELPAVTVRATRLHAGVRVLAIPKRLHIRPTGDDHGIEAGEHLAGHGRVGVNPGRQHHRNATRSVDMVEIAHRERGRALLHPVAARDGLDITRDPDDGSRTPHSGVT